MAKICWSKKVRTGLWVYDKVDPRHVGRLISIVGDVGTVRWPNGWKSELPVKNLIRTEAPR